MIKVGIIGGAGYTAGELIRLLINHPDVEIIFVHSESNAGNKITDIHTGLFGETDLIFTSETPFDETDYTKLHIVRGKYAEEELNKTYIGNAYRHDLIYKYYCKYGSKQALGFCCSRKHAEEMAA